MMLISLAKSDGKESRTVFLHVGSALQRVRACGSSAATGDRPRQPDTHRLRELVNSPLELPIWWIFRNCRIAFDGRILEYGGACRVPGGKVAYTLVIRLGGEPLQAAQPTRKCLVRLPSRYPLRP